jgi:hypothetical protein
MIFHPVKSEGGQAKQTHQPPRAIIVVRSCHKAKVWSAFGIAISFFWEMNLLMCHAMPLPELFFFFREDIKK